MERAPPKRRLTDTTLRAEGAAPPASSSLVRARSLPEDGGSPTPAVLGVKSRILSPPAAQSPAAPPASTEHMAVAVGHVSGQHATAALMAAAEHGGVGSALSVRSAPPPGFGPIVTPVPPTTEAACLANGSAAAQAEAAVAVSTEAGQGRASVSSPGPTEAGAASHANGAASPQRSPLKGRNSFLRSLRMRAAEGGDGGGKPAAHSVPFAVHPITTMEQNPRGKSATPAEGVADAVAAKLAGSHLTPPQYHASPPVMANGRLLGSPTATAHAHTPVLGLPAEEEAFLRSLGWSEGAGEDGGLTDAEIAAHRVRHSFAVR